MKNAYPVVFTKSEDGFLAYSPDFDINSFGSDFADAIYMIRDAIGVVGIDMEDEKEKLPVPSSADTVNLDNGEIVSFVDVDFTEYRRKNDMKTVRKNLTIPNWLNVEAEKQGINFSQTLQSALMEQLHLNH